jgi:formate hydrogenlyase subunit 6/NADH:ubiquinone oxidoreductase subunit I
MTLYGEYNPKMSSIRVLRNIELDVSIPSLNAECIFCGECVEWCFEEAISFVSWEEAALIRKETKIGRFPAPYVGSNTCFPDVNNKSREAEEER